MVKNQVTNFFCVGEFLKVRQREGSKKEWEVAGKTKKWITLPRKSKEGDKGQKGRRKAH